MAKIKNDYFKLLEEQINCSVQAAELLESIICNYDNIKLDAEKDRMHQIEHQADEIHHLISNKLATEFITVLEQEDFLQISHLIDDITDEIDEAVMEFYMYHIAKTPAKAYELSKIVNRCVKALQAVVADLRNFKKSDKLFELIKDVSSIETEADNVYVEGIHTLFASDVEYKTLVGHKAIYESLENCCDLCEQAANIIEQIIIKNT